MAPAYFDAFPNIALSRDAVGVLEVRLHSDGGPFRFSSMGRRQILQAFQAIGADRGSRVVILTGTGDSWCAEFDRDPANEPN